MGRTLRLAWGVLRRFYLVNFRKDYVREQTLARQGTCTRCGECCRVIFVCPFLKEGNHCRIYTRRSEQCREFPIDKRDLKDVPVCSFRFQDAWAGEKKPAFTAPAAIEWKDGPPVGSGRPTGSSLA